MNEIEKNKSDEKKEDTKARDMLILLPILLIWIGAIVYSNFY